MARSAPALVDLAITDDGQGLRIEWSVRDGARLGPVWGVMVRAAGEAADGVTVTNDHAEAAQAPGVSFYAARTGPLAGARLVDVRLWTLDGGFDVVSSGVPVVSDPEFGTQADAPAIPRAASRSFPVSSAQPSDVPANDRVKITVGTNGLYLVSSAEIGAALAVPVAEVQDWIAATNLAVSCMGTAVAWHPATANTGIVFYGEAYRDVYTERNVYWVRRGAGVAMPVIATTAPAGPVEQGTFWEIVRFERDLAVWATFPGENPMDPWFWGTANSTSGTNLAVRTPGAVATGEATFRLWSRSRYSDVPGLDGRLRLASAGVELGVFDADGIGPFTNVCTAPQSVLTNQTVNVRTVPVAASNPVHLVDSLTVGYRRRMEPVAGELIVRLEPGTNQVVAQGFEGTNVWVYGLSGDGFAARVTGASTVLTGGVARCAFDAVEGVRDYLLATRHRRPLAVEGVPPDPWAGDDHAVDYMVVAPEAFLPHLQPLLTLRESQLRVGVLTTRQLADNYDGGRLTPFVLRDFVSRSRSWTVPPRMVFLVGAGHYDTRRITGPAAHLTNHIATALATYPFQEAVSGTWFTGSDNDMADLDADGIPDVALGRLPVRTTNELARAIAKTLAYESTRIARTNAFVFTDVDTAGFVYYSGRWMQHLPAMLATRREMTADDADRVRVRSELWGAVDSGTWLVAYFGHGNRNYIGNATQPFLSYAEVGSLANAGRPVLFFGPTCQMNEAFYPSPSTLPSVVGNLGADLLRVGDGGAALVLAPSSVSFSDMGERFGSGFVDGIVLRRRRHAGEAVLDGLRALRAGLGTPPSGNHWLTSTMVLFGDPALDIRPADGILAPEGTTVIIR